MKKAVHDDAGFTLIESLMAVVVLVVGILVVIQMFTMSVHGRRNGKDMSIANNLAKRILEDMKTVGVTTARNNILIHGAKDVSDGGKVIYSFKAATAPAANVLEQKAVTSGKEFTIRVTTEADVPAAKLTRVTIVITWVGLDERFDPSKAKTHSVSYVSFFNS